MYSRFQSRPDAEIRIPEHYSGCAFSATSPLPSKKQEEPVVKTPQRPITPTKPSPPKALPPAILPPKAAEAEKAPPPAPVKSPLEPLGKAFPFSHGIGFEELLLLGLILLLSQSGRDGDTILWLALLLFCG